RLRPAAPDRTPARFLRRLLVAGRPPDRTHDLLPPEGRPPLPPLRPVGKRRATTQDRRRRGTDHRSRLDPGRTLDHVRQLPRADPQGPTRRHRPADRRRIPGQRSQRPELVSGRQAPHLQRADPAAHRLRSRPMECVCGCGREISGAKLTQRNLVAAGIALELLAWDKNRASPTPGPEGREGLIARGADCYQRLLYSLHEEGGGDPDADCEEWLAEAGAMRAQRSDMTTKRFLGR